MPTTQTNDPAIASFGTQIQVLSSAPGVTPQVFTTIAGVGDIDGPSRAIAETETTSHSTGIPVRTYIPSLIDPGTLSFPCYFNPADPTHSGTSNYGLEYMFEHRTVTQWRLVGTDPALTTRQFSGFVRELGESYPVEGVATRDTTVRISGLMQYVTTNVTLAPTNATPDATGGPATITVTATDGGAWLATTADPWITITSPTSAHTGSGTVNYTVAAQAPAAPARNGKITIAGTDFTVNQTAGA